jgi:hypothetical protein
MTLTTQAQFSYIDLYLREAGTCQETDMLNQTTIINRDNNK